MSTAFLCFSFAFIWVVAGASDTFEDVRRGYAFLFHDDNDLILVTKDNSCYFVSISGLAAGGQLAATPSRTQDTLIDIVEGRGEGQLSLLPERYFHDKYADPLANILCQGKAQFEVTVGGFSNNTFHGNGSFNGNTSFPGNGSFHGNGSFNGNTSFPGNGSFNGNTSFPGNFSFNSHTSYHGNGSFNGNISFPGNGSFHGNGSFGGNRTFQGLSGLLHSSVFGGNGSFHGNGSSHGNGSFPGNSSRAYTDHSCDFERGLCTWTNAAMDDFDWTRHSGPTSSYGTGPDSDHTLGTGAGHYLYIESSAPRSRGDEARLLSSTIFLSDICLGFWYNMYGDDIGSLSVFVQPANGSETTVWSRYGGDSSNAWRMTEISVRNQQSPFSLVIEGIIGGGRAGDIAIDDLTVSQGPCR